MKVPFIFRRLFKTKSLRFINLLGLILIFTSVLVSYAYISREMSFDKFYNNSERIGRLSLSFEGKQADGRIFTDSYDPIINEIPEIENVLKLAFIETTTLVSKDSKTTVNNLTLSSRNLFDFFDIPLVYGNSENVFDSPRKIIISERLALQLYGKTDVVGEQIGLKGRKYSMEKGFINGVFKNIPDNSHFHTDIIISEEDFSYLMAYYYLLIKEGINYNNLSSNITNKIKNRFDDPSRKSGIASIMPLTDIHLHSNVVKEIETGGNIDYIYLIGGANILLFIIVLFNLWLNSSVIFSYNKHYYQLLRLNGASSFSVVKDEFQVSFCVCFISLLFSVCLYQSITKYFGLITAEISFEEQLMLFSILLFSSTFISLLPILKSISYTIFSHRHEDLKTIRFSFSNIKYMLVAQYAIVVFIIIIAVGINNQISVIKTTQIGATNDSIIVFKEQPTEVVNNYELLRTALLKHAEIESVTAAMQLPGEGIRDMSPIRVEGNDEIIVTPLLVVGDDFFSFFGIQAISGNLPPRLTFNQQEEWEMFDRKVHRQSESEIYSTSLRDNYIINRKALGLLGFSSPEEAIGKEITLMHQSLNYIPGGKITGVVDDFIYTSVYEDAVPMLIVQRNLFMSCFMVRLSPDYAATALNILDSEWQKINADFPLSHVFLKDYYGSVYRNEMNAEQMVELFSALCLAVTILGLIVFMAFMIKMRNREIAIRKVNGASDKDIVYLMNKSLIISIIVSCIVAVPFSIYVMDIWLSNFAYKAQLGSGVFIGACMFVLLFSLLAVSWQSIQATKINLIDAIKGE